MNPIKSSLLVVEDDTEIRTQLKWALERDYDILLANDRVSALAAFRLARPLVVLLDLGLPPSPGTPEQGFMTLADILSVDSLTKVIVVTGQGEKQNALQAVGAGAYHFQSKPVEMEELLRVVSRCFYIAELEREFRGLQQSRAENSFEGILGTNPRMKVVFDAIRRVALSEAPVQILGESGTGKEMVARAIHTRSVRKAGPFVAINCSAIPESLIESELFGHEKGSFSGAHAQRKGRLESAEGGTLFLDEVGEIPLQIQVKLLRFLQERRIERVGGREEIEVDARVIAATNIDLSRAIMDGRFREDLYYRLAVVQVSVPALRDREDDVLLLAQSFLQKFAAQAGQSGMMFSPNAIHAMRVHKWPGNVRELQNRIRRASIMSVSKRITASDLDLDAEDNTQPGPTLRAAREATDRDVIQHSLRKYAGNVSAAAAQLEISRGTFYELMDKLGIKRSE